MPQIKRILIPVDFSEVSRSALHYGIGLAKPFHATLFLASVIEDRPAVVPDPRGSTTKKQRAFAQAQRQLEELLPDPFRKSTRCDCIVKTGDVDHKLLEAIADSKADLVVMGTHGRRGFRRWMLGSVTGRLLRKVTVPVVTVSHVESDIESAPLSKGSLLYATDLSYACKRALNLAYEFATAFDAELTLLHVIPPWSGIMSGISEQDHHELWKRRRQDLDRSIPEEIRRDGRVRSEVQEGVPYQSILDRAEEKDVGLIIVTLHGKHATERAVLGSTADRVIRGSHRPVLSLPTISV